MGWLSKVVCVIVGLTFLLASQPALGSPHLHHRRRRHGRLSGQPASLHAGLTNHAAFEAGLRTAARKLSLLPSDLSHTTRTTSEESKLDAQDSMGGSIMELDARKDEKAQQSVLHADVAASYYKSHFGNGVAGHGELKASKQSIIAHGELGKSASDSNTSRGRKRVESITEDLGTCTAAAIANGKNTARNFAVDQDKENAMEAANFSMLVKGRKDGLAHVSLDSLKKKQEKEYKSPQPN